MKQKQKQYWFRPKKFWKVFAFYYPTSRAGYVATLLLILPLMIIFQYIDKYTHSVSDTLFNFAPWGIAFAAIFDSLCFRFGEYPAWWKKNKAT